MSFWRCGRTMGGLRGSWTGPSIAALLTTGGALAQTSQPAAPPANATSSPNPRYLLTAPLQDPGSSNDLSFGPVVASSQPGIAAPPPSPFATSFAEFAHNIHGYISAGLATHDGHEFDGGVSMPLVPGKVDLGVSAATGQLGGFPPPVAGGKSQALHYDAYQVSLHVHPSDDWDAYIGIGGGSFRGPYGPYPYVPYAFGPVR